VRHGLCVANIGANADPRMVIELGEEAEAAGWGALFVWDHLGFVWGPPAADPWVTLAAVAARTSSLLLGTNITPVPRRRPHVLAH
jgi:alkanesulfonate monooxygenase SsuD/methylene tetrahydromethanopterin reductase-like flavin-dependent oxidoreductase (luciferase family)